ncbi:hypothetical protein NPX13_g11276 [Xylaria arbuscula]|uniref:Oxidoreductase n=1 Tax=Xylaria arbuscula TaxID=114810 RepID=A0A9W8N343_9PEZI|nr:hypothetical protein NPX13_g11276 [Xylaria arbuscula]
MFGVEVRRGLSHKLVQRTAFHQDGLVKGVAKAPEIAEDDINTMFTTNVTGLINMTQAILPIFLRRPNGGVGDIINIGSIAGREPYAGGSIYCATKAAVRSFTDSLRKELIATRVRVMEIDPGQVETEFSVVRFYGDKAKADAVYAGVDPLTPEDIAEVVVFVAGRRENVLKAMLKMSGITWQDDVGRFSKPVYSFTCVGPPPQASRRDMKMENAEASMILPADPVRDQRSRNITPQPIIIGTPRGRLRCGVEGYGKGEQPTVDRFVGAIQIDGNTHGVIDKI